MCLSVGMSESGGARMNRRGCIEVDRVQKVFVLVPQRDPVTEGCGTRTAHKAVHCCSYCICLLGV